MDNYILITFIVVLSIRLIFLGFSKRNEKIILNNGGIEYDKENTKKLTIVHTIFYFASLFESYVRNISFDLVSKIGIALLVFAFVFLCIVVYLLREIWTVKLMVASNHKYVDHWLFRTVKHPNYFLNIMPELLGMILLCHAWLTTVFVLPIYCFILYRRIKSENNILSSIILAK